MAFRLGDTSSGDRIEYANAGGRNGNTVRTISAWVNLDLNDQGVIWGAFNTGLTKQCPLWYLSAQNMLLYADFTGGYVQLCSFENLATGVWQHLLVLWDGTFTSSGIRFFTNGVENTYKNPTTGSGTAEASSGVFKVGNNIVNSYVLDAAVQEVACWTEQLNLDEISALSKAYSPAFIRPASRFFYDKLMRTGYNEWGGEIGTQSGVTEEPHNRMIYPSGPLVIQAPVTAPTFNPAWARNSNVMIGASQ